MINFDGWNVGFRDSFASTWLEFNNFDEANRIALHWEKWMAK